MISHEANDVLGISFGERPDRRDDRSAVRPAVDIITDENEARRFACCMVAAFAEQPDERAMAAVNIADGEGQAFSGRLRACH